MLLYIILKIWLFSPCKCKVEWLQRNATYIDFECMVLHSDTWKQHFSSLSLLYTIWLERSRWAELHSRKEREFSHCAYYDPVDQHEQEFPRDFTHLKSKWCLCSWPRGFSHMNMKKNITFTLARLIGIHKGVNKMYF